LAAISLTLAMIREEMVAIKRTLAWMSGTLAAI
jgi:hypothetical protein